MGFGGMLDGVRCFSWWLGPGGWCDADGWFLFGSLTCILVLMDCGVWWKGVGKGDGQIGKEQSRTTSSDLVSDI